VKKSECPDYRVFIGFVDTAGYFSGLAKGFDDLEVSVVFASVNSNPFQYAERPSSNFFVRLLKWSYSALSKHKRFSFLSNVFFVIHAVSRLLALLWSLFYFDVYIFSGCDTFLRGYDLPLLRACGKKIIFVFLGSSTRPPYLNGATVSKQRGISLDDCIRATARTKNIVVRYTQYADHVIEHPPCGHFQVRPFLAFLAMGFPFTAPEVESRDIKKDGVRILHAPSFPECKGSEVFREVITELRQRGFTIEYVEMINRSHNEVLQEIQRCDFVLDEIYSDSLLGGLGTEAAFYGRPTIVSGYVTPSDFVSMPHVTSLPPALHVLPDEIFSAVQRLIEDSVLRESLGAAARQFVRSHWAPVEVAKRFDALLSGRSKAEWYYSPSSISYLYGWGLSRNAVRTLVRSMIQSGGVETLCLSDKPKLESCFVTFSEECD